MMTIIFISRELHPFFADLEKMHERISGKRKLSQHAMGGKEIPGFPIDRNKGNSMHGIKRRERKGGKLMSSFFFFLPVGFPRFITTPEKKEKNHARKEREARRLRYYVRKCLEHLKKQSLAA